MRTVTLLYMLGRPLSLSFDLFYAWKARPTTRRGQQAPANNGHNQITPKNPNAHFPIYEFFGEVTATVFREDFVQLLVHSGIVRSARNTLRPRQHQFVRYVYVRSNINILGERWRERENHRLFDRWTFSFRRRNLLRTWEEIQRDFLRFFRFGSVRIWLGDCECALCAVWE